MLRIWVRQFAAVALLTARETIRQPIALLLVGSAVMLTGLLPVLLLHQMGDAQKLVRDSALAAHFVFGLLLGGYAACATVQHELRRGTVATVLVKPVSRGVFFTAKYVGVAGMLVVYSVAVGCAILLAARMAGETYTVDWWAGTPFYGAVVLAVLGGLAANYFGGRPFVSTTFLQLVAWLILAVVISSFFDAEGKPVTWGKVVDWRLVPAIVLVTMAVGVLAAIAQALATRLNMVPVMAICSVFFLVGLMTDYLFGRTVHEHWWAAWLYAVLPNWQHFWLTDALTGEEGRIPWVYVWRAGGYAFLYTVGILGFGFLAFRTAEIKA